MENPNHYKRYMLTVLLAILAFNFVDRIALGLVLQDIKLDLSLSDSQLGLLSGIAFALFYSILGIPIARWADRGNRVTIISLTTAVWCAAVALCGAATSFLQAAAGVLATVGSDQRSRPGGVEHIDLDADAGDDGDWPVETDPEEGDR